MKTLKYLIFLLILLIVNYVEFNLASPSNKQGKNDGDFDTLDVIFNDEITPDDLTTPAAPTLDEREGGDLTAVDEIGGAVNNDETGTTVVPVGPPVFLQEPEISAAQYASETGNVVEESNPLLDMSQFDGLTVKTFDGSNSRYYAGRSNPCQCGRPGIRIVGGEPALIQEYPWTAVLYRRRFFFGGLQQYCGGTLINNLYILTAAHCVDGMIPSGIEVGLHDENLAVTDELETPTQMFKVESITMHPEYNRRTIDNDIALLRLDTPALLRESLVPACLPASNEYLFEGQNATAAGWGATESGGSTSKILRKVHVPVLTNEECMGTRYKDKITQNMLCAGFVKEGQKDSCQGDSGGPLIIENGGRRTLIGVVSWGYGCAEPNSPGVYTRVGRYPGWIVQNTLGAEWCSG